ncbi:MAG TPA: class I SAM-dependent methyltransferase [Solirubrobacteraceae bacterium]|nr:class I SAM-dependent methyltransferase [Solirubrobacteraceae bacterium]
MPILSEDMRAYYDARAGEYDDWWLGRGLFADRERPGWPQEVARLIACVRELAPARVLDVACGTGFLTRHLRGEIAGLDQSPAMAAIAAERVPGLRMVVDDAVPLPFAPGEFDRVFTGHFYGHLLAEERAAFLAEARRVAPQLVVVDSAQRAGTGEERWQQRTLNDGSEHRVYKRYFTGAQLADELGGGEVLFAGDWFVVVCAS